MAGPECDNAAGQEALLWLFGRQTAPLKTPSNHRFRNTVLAAVGHGDSLALYIRFGGPQANAHFPEDTVQVIILRGRAPRREVGWAAGLVGTLLRLRLWSEPRT
jgi:hypothetical protein